MSDFESTCARHGERRRRANELNKAVLFEAPNSGGLPASALNLPFGGKTAIPEHF